MDTISADDSPSLLRSRRELFLIYCVTTEPATMMARISPIGNNHQSENLNNFLRKLSTPETAENYRMKINTAKDIGDKCRQMRF
jgi:hypothetical protein